MYIVKHNSKYYYYRKLIRILSSKSKAVCKTDNLPLPPVTIESPHILLWHPFLSLPLCLPPIVHSLTFWPPSIPCLFLAWQSQFFRLNVMCFLLFFFCFPIMSPSLIYHNMFTICTRSFYIYILYLKNIVLLLGLFVCLFLTKAETLKEKSLNWTFIVPLPKVCVFCMVTWMGKNSTFL